MYTENQFVREFTGSNNPRQIWEMRQFYRTLSNKKKKEFTSDLVRYKKSLDFKEWWTFITYNIEEGKKIHKRNTKRKFLVDYRLEAVKQKVRDPKFREYLGHINTDVE